MPNVVLKEAYVRSYNTIPGIFVGFDALLQSLHEVINTAPWRS